MTFLEHYTKEQIEDFVKQSHNTHEVLMRMGRSANSGSNTLALSVYLKENNIDTSHFKSRATPYTPDEIFIEHSPATQRILRKYYTQGSYSEYKCAICGLAPFWNGMPLVLRLDHINGVSDDHRLENLRWICANCNTQLPTYGAKRKKKHCYCLMCGTPIARNVSGLCSTCRQLKRLEKQQAKEEERLQKRQPRTPKDHSLFLKEHALTLIEFARLILTEGFCGAGRRFNVSSTQIRRVCKACGLPTVTTQLQAWYQAQVPSAMIRRIYQIDPTSQQIVAEFATYGEAQRALKLTNMTTISNACKTGKKAYGFLWKETHAQL